MNTSSQIRKVYQGTADRHQMFRLFDRHAQRPNRFEGDASMLYAGEWFEITEREHDYMFEVLPPLWIRGSMFAMREFLTGSVTSVFFALRIDGVIRFFHGYCDLSDGGSVEEMRLAIIERETRPVRAMTRDERLEHIWSTTADAYRRYADETAANYPLGHRAITLFSASGSARLKLLDDLTDDEIASKLPVQLRHLGRAAAAA
ncbi:DUF1419 domain-containing protein [Agrobacterium tumefaciens]|uniref:DUF1419 domain-containing protein n=1 Tax=Agrobacterium tumefaciens TaxID=358 RepID=A0AA44F5I3_AGRTU|nr:DUF1419 domain-containing protein [Agrobacterium tumefaciens]NSL21614.1 DUF1419 domain-containing protein [Agrobacterium tumefaciens]NTB86970.1 DUF1419 domain-containing protein [Agrobacterium tumefaciens]NTC18610.1 DUF1419 domain-containing protein [Agrobacterium tumefaciens]NTC28988.1 DUF1419 domain-containing protein [Agrobacterium tumefaciens]NTC58338.1 DUF1419 domain-containing protein [Agrobacterium tumefaciens]